MRETDYVGKQLTRVHSVDNDWASWVVYGSSFRAVEYALGRELK